MKNKLLLITLLSLLSIAMFAQEKLYTSYFEVINLSKDYQNSATRLLKTYVEQENKFELVLPQDTTIKIETKDHALMKAKSLDYKYILTGQLNRVGETIIISVSMYNIDGTKVWNTMQKALSKDDIDPILQKVAQSLNSFKVAKEVKETTVADAPKDAKAPQKVASKDSSRTIPKDNTITLNKKGFKSSLGIDLGGALLPMYKNIDTKFSPGFGFIYSGDIKILIFDIKGSFYFNDVKMYNLSLHFYYPFNTNNITPFVGGGLGYGGTDITFKTLDASNNNIVKSQNAYGMSVYAGGGYIFNRNSNVNLRLSANLFSGLYQVDGKTPLGVIFGMTVLF